MKVAQTPPLPSVNLERIPHGIHGFLAFAFTRTINAPVLRLNAPVSVSGGRGGYFIIRCQKRLEGAKKAVSDGGCNARKISQPEKNGNSLAKAGMLCNNMTMPKGIKKRPVNVGAFNRRGIKNHTHLCYSAFLDVSTPTGRKWGMTMKNQEQIARDYINRKRRERYRDNPEREQKNRLRSYVNVLVREGVLVPLTKEDGGSIPAGHAVYVLKEGVIA